MVENQKIIQGVNRQGGEGIGVPSVIHLVLISKALQFTVATGGAEEAEVIALSEKQL